MFEDDEKTTCLDPGDKQYASGDGNLNKPENASMGMDDSNNNNQMNHPYDNSFNNSYDNSYNSSYDNSYGGSYQDSCTNSYDASYGDPSVNGYQGNNGYGNVSMNGNPSMNGYQENNGYGDSSVNGYQGNNGYGNVSMNGNPSMNGYQENNGYGNVSMNGNSSMNGYQGNNSYGNPPMNGYQGNNGYGNLSMGGIQGQGAPNGYPTSQKTEKGKSKKPFIIGGVIAGVLVSAAAVFFIMYQNTPKVQKKVMNCHICDTKDECVKTSIDTENGTSREWICEDCAKEWKTYVMKYEICEICEEYNYCYDTVLSYFGVEENMYCCKECYPYLEIVAEGNDATLSKVEK